MTGFGIPESQALAEQGLAPWVMEMGITFDRVDGHVAILRVPDSPRLKRVGGIVCGQAMMSLADTAMIFAIFGYLGAIRNITTVSQTTSFLRPAGASADLIAEARVLKPGRQIVYGEISLHCDNPEKPVAHVITNYMMLPD